MTNVEGLGDPPPMVDGNLMMFVDILKSSSGVATENRVMFWVEISSPGAAKFIGRKEPWSEWSTKHAALGKPQGQRVGP